uniref:Glycosyltransferase family 92 protein n=1 Tax=Strigamia maritima TaxID=126957 RepID=T1IJ89_STRMM
MCVITLVLNAFTKEIQATMMTILRKLWYSRRGKIYYLTLTVILMYNIISYYNRDLPYYQPEIPEVNSDELVIFSARDLESLAQKIPQLPIQQLIGNKFSKIKYKSVMVDRVQLPPVFCQLWLNKEKKQFVTPAIFRSLWPSIWGNFKDGELLPHLISCLLPIQMGSSVPNILHPNVAKVLSYYEERGTVKVTKLSLPGNQPNFPETIGIYQKFAIFRKRQNEVIPYNDCFYRNVHLYDYIALLDVDEIILPTSPNSFTWNDMMSSVTDRNKDAICARNIYFYEKLETKNNHIPRHLHMLRHSIRSINYTKPPFYVKCLHNASSVITLHNHLPVVCASKDKKTSR